MPRCEDYPCCGHENGCCPNYDAAGRQTDMVCICGARLPINNRFSICNSCLSRDDDGGPDYRGDDWQEVDEYDEAD
jgi:hypothetical protein